MLKSVKSEVFMDPFVSRCGVLRGFTTNDSRIVCFCEGIGFFGLCTGLAWSPGTIAISRSSGVPRPDARGVFVDEEHSFAAFVNEAFRCSFQSISPSSETA